MILIFAGRRKNRCALHVLGHAGCAPKGQDIVCAGVSTLVQTLAATLAAFEVKGLHTTLQSGCAKITCTGSGLADALFYQTIIGLAQLAKAYPNAIQMRTEGYFS